MENQLKVEDRVEHVSANKGVGVIKEIGINGWVYVIWKTCKGWFHVDELKRVE